MERRPVHTWMILRALSSVYEHECEGVKLLSVPADKRANRSCRKRTSPCLIQRIRTEFSDALARPAPCISVPDMAVRALERIRSLSVREPGGTEQRGGSVAVHDTGPIIITYVSSALAFLTTTKLPRLLFLPVVYDHTDMHARHVGPASLALRPRSLHVRENTVETITACSDSALGPPRSTAHGCGRETRTRLRVARQGRGR